jgi:hypothetical protein
MKLHACKLISKVQAGHLDPLSGDCEPAPLLDGEASHVKAEAQV